MKIAFVVNALREMGPQQTTTMLAQRAAALGHEVWVQDADRFGLEPDGGVVAEARRLSRAQAEAGGTAGVLEALSRAPLEPLRADALDVVMLRVNPGREPRRWVLETLLDFARILSQAGVLVLNDPDGLSGAQNKLYLRKVPEVFRPRTLVSRDRDHIRAFVEAQPGGAVLKPLAGTRGRDVFLAHPGELRNLNQIIDVLGREGGYAMVREFVPEAVDGDVRLVVMDGALLEVDGAGAAVRRVPAAHDFRSNVHVGGRAVAAEITDVMRACVAAVGPILAADGIFLAGLDFIGGKLVEINVFATGGLHDAQAFYARDFTGAIIDAVARRVGA